MGLPKEDTYFANNKVKYDATTKTWICLICNLRKNKYNRKQMMGHVNTAHGENKPFKPNRTGKGKLIEVENDVILNMEHDYGRVRTEREYGENKDDFTRKLICNKCGHGEEEKDSIKKTYTKTIM